MSPTKTDKPITARDILACLVAKHSKDVCVPECKDGPTQAVSTHLRMDLWTMKKSWTNPNISVYEIKVSRGDFMQDDKWRAYLPYCNQFYFCCPHKMIYPGEISAEAGLCWASQKGTRIYTKKKAPYRDVDIPESLWRYIVMCRAEITKWDDTPANSQKYWENWLAEQEEDQRLGLLVKSKIGKIIRETQYENAQLKRQIDGYKEIEARIRELGFDPMIAVSSWKRELVQDRLKGELSMTRRAAANAIQRIQAFILALDKETQAEIVNHKKALQETEANANNKDSQSARDDDA